MSRQPSSAFDALLAQVRACTLCTAELPLGPRPVVQLQKSARVLIASQAPGVRVHRTGIPFNDPSGDRLREWMGVTREVFYDAERVAILPMSFCFPGAGASGDLPPSPRCAPTWREALLGHLDRLELILVIGRYAHAYHLPGARASVTENVLAWRTHWPRMAVLPHPSPRNNRWLDQNPWFATDVLPTLRKQVATVLEK